MGAIVRGASPNSTPITTKRRNNTTPYTYIHITATSEECHLVRREGDKSSAKRKKEYLPIESMWLI
jgi:hypothetical protein